MAEGLRKLQGLGYTLRRRVAVGDESRCLVCATVIPRNHREQQVDYCSKACRRRRHKVTRA